MEKLLTVFNSLRKTTEELIAEMIKKQNPTNEDWRKFGEENAKLSIIYFAILLLKDEKYLNDWYAISKGVGK